MTRRSPDQSRALRGRILNTLWALNPDAPWMSTSDLRDEMRRTPWNGRAYGRCPTVSQLSSYLCKMAEEGIVERMGTRPELWRHPDASDGPEPNDDEPSESLPLWADTPDSADQDDALALSCLAEASAQDPGIVYALIEALRMPDDVRGALEAVGIQPTLRHAIRYHLHRESS